MPTLSACTHPLQQSERDRKKERETLGGIRVRGGVKFVHEHPQAESAGVPVRTSAVNRKRATMPGRERESLWCAHPLDRSERERERGREREM